MSAPGWADDAGTDPGDPYAGAARGWAHGAGLLYGPLARVLVARAPHDLAGHRIVDVGAGTGLGSAALLAAGARPVELDRSADMLRWDRAARPPAAVGDVSALPLRTGAVDGVLAAFVLNHLTDPAAGLRELARVTRPGGALIAAVFGPDNTSPARDRIDALAAQHGYRPPDWYVRLKAVCAPLLEGPTALAAAARAAGWAVLAADTARVDCSIHTPDQLVDYRLGQAQFAGWLAGLGHSARAVRHALVAGIVPVMAPYRPEVVTLVGLKPESA